ncbi:MAG: hypothetical protein UT29_C0001G0159 [Candidatus Yanofskybacteria bacterium GW2011_GWA1_39_13]|uniref:SbsA Ig-like domain-containing protein n=1 Tax=Yanofskybacteria sp. (strain GW2011_GWA1_39_13) TaxID=1619019 RepID=A0A0G0MF64_YANXG|nr:MAG: hypothetical protein UT29_C0001G0159 [Candidatus Yanofskybacteria bacterium GW2011_GWA1_39_13]
MSEAIVSGSPEIKISLSEPLKVNSEFYVSVNIGKLSGDLKDFSKPLNVWLASTQHFEIENGDRSKLIKTISADEIKTGLSKVTFLAKVVSAGDNNQPRVIAYFSYNHRPCGKVERTLTVIAD